MSGSEYQRLLDRDSRTAPPVLRAEQAPELGTEPIPAERYTSPEWAALERRHVWPKVWQLVCREEDIPDPGDVHVYEIVGLSILVVREGSGEVRAYYNSCLHRGRRLVDQSGHVGDLRCGFHGWTWSLDGALKTLPCRHDFAHISDAELRLPRVQVGRWGGFIFINMDADAPPLLDYLGVLPDHFARWRLEECYKAVHVARVIDCNWKIAQEAFMESYHVIATHPQILPFFADVTAEYDVYGPHVNRNLAAFAEPSPHLPAPSDKRTLIEGMLGLWGRPAPANLDMEEATPARAVLGDMARRAFSKAAEIDLDDATDAEMIDAIVYNVFPNFAPWGGFAPNIVYRWRPLGDAPDRCIMEVMFLKRVPQGAPTPRGAPVRWLGENEAWANAPELGALGSVIDQDMSNMPDVQLGLKSSGTGRVHLGRYMESRIRHFHATLGAYVRQGEESRASA